MGGILNADLASGTISPEGLANRNNFSKMFQDYIILAGLLSPGVARMTSFQRVRDFEIRKGPFQSGAFLVYKGENLAKFTIELEVAQPPDTIVQWLLFANLLNKVPDGLSPALLSSFALGINYPILNSAPINISDVVVESFTPWSQGEMGEWTMQIAFVEFRMPLEAGGKPDKSIPSIAAASAEGGGALQGGGDAQDLNIQKLTAQYQAGLSPAGK